MSLYKYRFESETLREKLLWRVMLPMALLLLINIALVYKFGHGSADRRHDRYLADVSEILVNQLYFKNGKLGLNTHGSMLTEDKQDVMYYSLSVPLQKHYFGTSDLPHPPETLSEKTQNYEAVYKGRPMRLMAVLVSKPELLDAKIAVVVGKTMVLHEERAQEWMWRVLPANLIFMFITGGTVWWGVDRGLRSLMRLRDEVIHRSSQDFRPLSETNVVAEIRPLIDSFNELLVRVDDSMALQRRFVSDAAHQLRTPIAGLKAQTELALRLSDPEDIRYSLQQMHKATEHAARLINQLLLLARSEPGVQQQTEIMSILDLASLVRQTLEDWVPAALQKHIDLGFEPTISEARIHGDAFLLIELLNNLLDNAIRYTQSGGCITVRVAEMDNKIVLEVEDNGQGVPDSEKSRVFERFYRVLGSNQDGCGLGLAIVREIVQRHGAKISLLSGADNRGTRIRIVFQASQNESA